jgi:hypothetical protein
VSNGITGAEFPKQVKSLQVMANEGDEISLSDSLLVTDNLVLGGGILKLNGGKLLLGENGNPATIVQTGDTAQNYINASAYAVKLAVNTEEPELSLPLGTATHYLPIKLRFNGITPQANPYLLADVKEQVLPSLVAESPNHYLNNYWNIDPINFTATSYSVQLTYPTARVTGNSAYLIPYKYNNVYGLLRASGINAYTRTTNGSFQTLTWNGLTSFSSFGAGDGEDLLPVSFGSFTGKYWNGAAKLNWSTYSELNNQGFHIEKSTNGLAFERIAFLKGAGNSNAKQLYQFIDKQFKESAYYRLVQSDFDGATYTTQSLYVVAEAGGLKVMLESNPANSISLISSNEKEIVRVSVVSSLGAKLFSAEGTFEIVAQLLREKSAVYQSGIYMVNLTTGYTNYNFKAVVK